MKDEKRVWRPTRRGFLRTGIIGGSGILLAGVGRPGVLLAAGSWSGQVGASSDDAREVPAPGGTVYLTETQFIYRGGNGSSFLGFRFTQVAIPQGANITSATFSLYNSSSPTDKHTDPDMYIAAEKIANSPTFQAVNFNISSRTATTNQVLWTGVSDINPPAWMNSFDISSVISEVVGQSTWQSGNALSILCSSGRGDTPGLRLEFWDGNATEAAKLTASWS